MLMELESLLSVKFIKKKGENALHGLIIILCFDKKLTTTAVDTLTVSVTLT